MTTRGGIIIAMVMAFTLGMVVQAELTPPPGREAPSDVHGILRFRTSYAVPPRCSIAADRWEFEYFCVEI